LLVVFGAGFGAAAAAAGLEAGAGGEAAAGLAAGAGGVVAGASGFAAGGGVSGFAAGGGVAGFAATVSGCEIGFSAVVLAQPQISVDAIAAARTTARVCSTYPPVGT